MKATAGPFPDTFRFAIRSASYDSNGGQRPVNLTCRSDGCGYIQAIKW
jgi:hypothetical protein